MDRKVYRAPLAAALAAGISFISIGVFTILTEAFPQVVKPLLTLDNGIDPLYGTSIFAVFIFIISWLAIRDYFKKRDSKNRIYFQ